MATLFAAVRELFVGCSDAEPPLAQLRELLVNADDALFRDAIEAFQEPTAVETVGLCFACFRTSAVEGSQGIVCAGLPHDHLRLQVARQRLTNSVVAWLNQGAAPLPPHAPAFAAMLLEELPHLGKEELLAVVHAALSVFEAASPSMKLLLDLLPTALKLLLEARPDASQTETEVQIDPCSTRDAAVQRLCCVQWPSEQAASILDVAQRLPLTPAQAGLLVSKAYRQALSCELQAIPVLVHQILLLPRNLATSGRSGAAPSSLGGGARRSGPSLRVQVMRGLVNLMDQLAAAEKHRSQGPVLLEVSGVVLQHIASVARHDLLLIPEWLDSLEGGGWTVSPAAQSTATAAKSSTAAAAAPPSLGSFLCLVLSALCSPQQQLAPRALSVVKTLLLQAFTAEEQQQRGSWEGSERATPGAHGDQTGQPLGAALVRAVSTASKQFGDLVIQGALELGSLLMGALSSGRSRGTGPIAQSPAVEGMAGDDVHRLVAVVAAELQVHQEQQRRRRLGRRAQQPCHEGEGAEERARQLEVAAAPRVRCCLVGMRLVAAVLEEHESAREEVMRRLAEALQSASAPAAAFPHVLLLGMVVRRRPRLLLPLQNQLQALLEQLPSLSCEAARQGLLLALWPVLRSRRVLQDATVALLRKVMFSREVSSRLLAVTGFLHLILDQLQAAAAAADPAAAAMGLSQTLSQAGTSQSTLSQMGGLSAGCGVSLLSELTGFLRRALGQQAAVRAQVYDGLQRIVQVDPGSLGSAAELLMPHVEQYLPALQQDQQGQAPQAPLQLLKCTECKAGEVRLVEDMPALLACMQSLVLMADAPVSDALGAAEGPGVKPGQAQGSDPSDYFGSEALLRPPGADGETALTTAWAQHEEVQSLVRTYHELRQQVVQCDVALWGLEARAEWWPGSAAGAARQLRASCLLGCIEVLMEGEAVRAARSGGWSESSREWMAAALTLHRSVASMARNTKAPGQSAGRKKAPGKENTAGSVGPQGAGTAQVDATGGSPDGVGDHAKAAGKGKAGAGVKAPDYVKVDDRLPAMSPACLAQLTREVTAAVGSAGGGGSHEQGLGDLARQPSFASFLLRKCLNLFRTGTGNHSVLQEGDLLSALSDAFGTPPVAPQQSASVGPAVEGSSLMPLAGPALAACWAVIGSDGCLGCSAEELEADMLPEPAAEAAALDAAGSTSQQGAAAGGKRHGWGKKGGAAADDGEAAAPTGRPPTGKKTKRTAPAEPDASSEARVLLAARLAKTILGSTHSLQQLADALQPLPLPQPSTTTSSQQLPSGRKSQGQPPWPPAGSSWSGPLAVVGPRLLHLHAQLQYLMQSGSFEAAQALVDCVQHVGHLLPPQIRLHLSDWVFAAVCKQESPQVVHEGLAKASIHTCCSLKGAPMDLELLATVASEVQRLVGVTGQQTQTQHDTLPILHESVAQQVAGCVLSLLSERLQGMDLGFAAARALADSMTRHAAAEAAELDCWCGLALKDLAAYARLEKLMHILSLVVNTRLGLAQVLELQATVVLQAYKVLTAVTKHSTALAAASPKGTPCPQELSSLVLLVNRDLTPSVYSVIQDTQSVDPASDQARAFNRKRAAAIKKEQKNIPAIIYQVEIWEKQLLALGKACGSNMLKGAKRTINRDFKLELKEQEHDQPQVEAVEEQAAELKARGKKRAQKDGGTGGRKTKKGGANAKEKLENDEVKEEEHGYQVEGDEDVEMVEVAGVDDDGAGAEEEGYQFGGNEQEGGEVEALDGNEEEY